MKKLRAIPLVLAFMLLACLAVPATAAHHVPQVYEMDRDDMRITVRVLHDEIVRARVRARERCGGNGATGFLVAEMPSRKPIPIGPGGRFDYEESFDDARGHGRLDFEGRRQGNVIRGVFLFQNLDDRSCGSGRPGNRRVLFTARLSG
jgi:hypothetical protein